MCVLFTWTIKSIVIFFYSTGLQFDTCDMCIQWYSESRIKKLGTVKQAHAAKCERERERERKKKKKTKYLQASALLLPQPQELVPSSEPVVAAMAPASSVRPSVRVPLHPHQWLVWLWWTLTTIGRYLQGGLRARRSWRTEMTGRRRMPRAVARLPLSRLPSNPTPRRLGVPYISRCQTNTSSPRTSQPFPASRRRCLVRLTMGGYGAADAQNW